jgi:hypothetical protein
MKTEKVVAMIDTITDGRQFAHRWEGEENSFNFASSDSGFAVQASSFGCSDPRTAREIAGALVAWANRKEGNGNETEAFRVSADHFSKSRAEWYERSVKYMSQETKNRNLKDLHSIALEYSDLDVDYDDIQKAIQVLRDAGGNFDHTGTTYDFLEIVCNISRVFTPKIAGEFIESLTHEHSDQLAFLRITDWKFEFRINMASTQEQIIKLHYTPR